MVTKRDDDDRQQGEYRAICLWKMDWQSFAIYRNYFKSLLKTVGLSVDPLATFFAKSWRFTRMLPIVYTSKYSPE